MRKTYLPGRIHRPLPFPLMMGVPSMPNPKDREKGEEKVEAPSTPEPQSAPTQAPKTEEKVEAPSTSKAQGEPTGYLVNHAFVGPHPRGGTLRAEQLVPVPKGSTPEETKTLRKEGIDRLMDLGAVIPVYEEEKEKV